MKIRKQYITPKFRPIVLASAATLLAGSNPSVEGGGSGPGGIDINDSDAKSFSGFYDFEE